MSKITEYIASLVPGFQRSQVEEDVRILIEAITESTLPPYASALVVMPNDDFRSRDVKSVNDLFTKTLRRTTKLRGNFIQATYDQLENTLEVLNDLSNGLDKYFEKDIVKGSMTYARANVLRYIELANFNAKYARKLLLWTLHEEQTNEGQDLDSPFAKADIDWVFANRDLFFTSVRILSIEPRKVKGLFKNIPDMIIVPEENDAVEVTVGADKLDPLGMNIIPVQLNPIYHIGMLVSEWQAARYQVTKEELRTLEYRLLSLKEGREGKRDAKLEENIEYTENRIKKLNYKIAKLEED